VRPIFPAIAVLLIAGSAFADEATRNGAEAEELFQNGKAALARKDNERACQYFQDSQRLDPGIGTLLNLAICHELIGKNASAWSEFKMVEELASTQKPPQYDRMRTAKEHSDLLAPGLSRIRILVLPSVQVAGITVSLDGREVLPSQWGMGVPVDAGPHAVEVIAPHKQAFKSSLQTEAGQSATVQVLALQNEVVREVKDPSEGRIAERSKAEEDARSTARTQKTAGEIVMFSGGGLFLGGVVFGILASARSSVAAQCNSAAPCGAAEPRLVEARDAYGQANVLANISNVLVPVGLLAGGVGAYLFFSAKTSKQTSLLPSLLPGSYTLQATGQF
jgi:hypothetical protein